MPRKLPQKTLVLLAFIAVIGLAVGIAMRGGSAPAAVSTIRAVRQNLTSSISSNGKVEPVDPHIIQTQLTTFIEEHPDKAGRYRQARADSVHSQRERSRKRPRSRARRTLRC